MTDQEQHNHEIWINLNKWNDKPLLQKIYHDFYKRIKNQLNYQISGKIVELGSGIGKIKEIINECITTDIFPNHWIDQSENAYSMSFENESVSNLILFDVFHHIQYPGEAFKEFYRVLKKKGRLIIFDPDISLLGFLVYGLFHHEPVAFFKKIIWHPIPGSNLTETPYYAAQGNASRIFYYHRKRYSKFLLNKWKIQNIKRISAISYVASGGYKKKQLYPAKHYHKMRQIDKLLDVFPLLFSTRILIVIEKQ